jgi:S1-C subfamily serine protease
MLVMKRIALLSGLALALTMPCTVDAQEQQAPTEVKKIKSRNDVLKETFADISKKTRAHSVKVQANGKTKGYGVFLQGGYILTAASNVRGSNEFNLLGSDFKAKGTLLGVDNNNHVALIKVASQKDRAGVQLGKSKGLFIGQFVITVGLTDQPLAVGVVSALNRRVKKAARKGGGNFFAQLFGGGQGPNGSTQNYAAITHHDSKINAAHYGSPVYTADGLLVGINVEKAYRGSAYFVAIDSIRAVFADLKSGKGVPAKPRREATQPKKDPAPVPAPAAGTKGFLGISVQGINGGAELKGTGHKFGAKVSDVHPKSGANKAGINPGDIVVSVNGTMINSFDQFIGLMKGKKVGDTLVLTVIRNGWKRDLTITLGARPKN